MVDKALVVTILMALVITCLVGFAVWLESTSPKIELLKSEWECAKTETHITNIIVGGKLMPQPQPICVEYRRK